MESILADARSHLPLSISTVETDFAGMLVAGENWHLRINTEWKIFGGDSPETPALTSEQDPGADELAAALAGLDVVGFHIEYHGPYGDIVLLLQGGGFIEVISDFPYGEWIFSIWEKGDPKRTPVFDLSGPCPAT